MYLPQVLGKVILPLESGLSYTVAILAWTVVPLVSDVVPVLDVTA